MARRAGGYPEAISRTLEELRRSRKSKLSISVIRGRYCVYEYIYILDWRSGARRKRQFYIGWIDKDGMMTQALHRSDRTRVSGIEQYIEASSKSEGGGAHAAIHPDSTDRRILTEISMDSRISAPEIAKKVGISRSAASYRLEKLERGYGIRKTIELLPERFGFTRYMVTVKFLKGRPDIPAMRALFEGEPRIQLVLLMRGDYDMFIYVIAEDTKKLDDVIYGFRSDRLFAGAESVWQVGYMIESYGFVPLRSRFFDLLEEKIWSKSRDSPRKGVGQLLPSEYATMKELNLDAGIDFVKIDEKYGLHKGSAQYTYHKLLEKRIIERSTINMQRLPIKYCGFIYMKQTDINAFNIVGKEQLMEMIEENDTPANGYALVADVSSPYGIIFIPPVFEGSVESIVERLGARLRGIEVETAVVTEQLVGYLGLRRFESNRAATD